MKFTMVDKILDLVPGDFIVAEKTLRSDNELFADHFPGFPIIPGVLLTEMMAQAAGKCLDAEKMARGKAMLGKIRSATFRQWVKPDERAVIHAQIDSSREQYASAKCFIEVGGARVCSGDLFFTFLPLDRLAPDYADPVLESYLQRGDDAHIVANDPE